MLKKTVSYTDFDDKPQQETLWFNLTKADVLDNLDLIEEAEGVQNMLDGEKRSLTTSEIRRLIQLVKKIAQLSYGVRSEDGKRFSKKPELWEEFLETAVYDQFLVDLFTKPEEGYAFIVGILPKDLTDQVKTTQPELFNAPTDESVAIENVTDATPEDTRPAWIREDREPTKDEVKSMTPDQLREAFARKLNK